MLTQKKFVVCLIMSVLFGCEGKTPTNPHLDPTTIPSTTKISTDFKSPTIKNDPKNTDSLLINGIKMQNILLPLRKGSRIYNSDISNYGTISGSIIVITQDLGGLLKNSQIEINTLKIAESTYRLTPFDDSFILPLYQSLTSNIEASRVEMEIDYSGTPPINRDKKPEEM